MRNLYILFLFFMLSSCSSKPYKVYYGGSRQEAYKIFRDGTYHLSGELFKGQIGKWNKKDNIYYLTSEYNSDSFQISVICESTKNNSFKTITLRDSQNNYPMLAKVYYYSSRFFLLDSSQVFFPSRLVDSFNNTNYKFAKISLPIGRKYPLSNFVSLKDSCFEYKIIFNYPERPIEYPFKNNEPYRVVGKYLVKPNQVPVDSEY